MSIPHDTETDWLAASSLDDWYANILCVGEIAPHQNLNLACLALAEYRRKYDPFARLIFAGPQTDATYSQELRDFADSLDLGGHVLITEAADAGQRKALYLTADVALQTGMKPSSDALQEAERFRVPLVSTAMANTPAQLAKAIHERVAG
jgi:glycosyltransferase involved in cell wall biosynthesis